MVFFLNAWMQSGYREKWDSSIKQKYIVHCLIEEKHQTIGKNDQLIPYLLVCGYYALSPV